MSITGTPVTTGVLSPYALSTLSGVKAHLRITDDSSDALLTEIINQASLLIERVTGIKFKARDYRQRIDGIRQRRAVLRSPIIHITRIAWGAEACATVQYTGSGIRASCSIYRTDEDAGGLRLQSIGTDGTATATNLAFATYGTVALLAAQVAATTGWTASVSSNQPSADLNPRVWGDAKNQVAYLTYPSETLEEYTVDYERGYIEFTSDNFWNRWQRWENYHHPGKPEAFPRGTQGFLVEYRAGYETIPADVDLACRELVAERYYEGLDNPAVKSQTLGPFSVTFTDSNSASVRDALAHYIDWSTQIA